MYAQERKFCFLLAATLKIYKGSLCIKIKKTLLKQRDAISQERWMKSGVRTGNW
jgi:hypothetical protein